MKIEDDHVFDQPLGQVISKAEIHLAITVGEYTGSCPADSLDWYRLDDNGQPICEEICGTAACGDRRNPAWRCWFLWAEERGKHGG